MIFVLKYFFVICLFGLGIIIFNIFINIHIYQQLFLSFLYNNFETIYQEYDYIIVGSGTAGSIVALRLSQDSNNKILLLEAGSFSNFLFDVPAIGPMLQKTDLDWQYETIPQENSCKGLKNNVSSWPMGKIFGGTHRLNNMIYVRGHKNDFKDWYINKTDYNYEKDILYYFKKTENWLSSKYDSPVHLDNLNFVSNLAEAILDAAEILGYPVKNINANPGLGFMKPQITTKNNKRWTTSHSLLQKNFENLQILTNAHVNKILFKSNFEASGVQYTFLGSKKLVKAKKGIILSAGVIGSPKILLLSGLGPQKHLNNVKIHTKKNLPIGENLQDHVSTGLDLIILNQSLSVNIDSLVSPISALKYFFYSSGPWTIVGCEVIGFCHTNLTDLNSIPNLGFMVIPTGVSSDAGKHLKNIFGINTKIWGQYFTSMIGKHVISILPIVLHPKSKGWVRLRDSNPHSGVDINPNYLSDKYDVEILLKGIDIIKKIIQTYPMQKLGAKLNPTRFIGCDNYAFDTKNYWECYIRHITLTVYHPIGTCKLGDPKNKNTVVDYNFKVLGTNKLFVVDSSVVPNLPSGNPNAIIAMLAEKASDIIKYEEFLTQGSCWKFDAFYEQTICRSF